LGLLFAFHRHKRKRVIKVLIRIDGFSTNLPRSLQKRRADGDGSSSLKTTCLFQVARHERVKLFVSYPAAWNLPLEMLQEF